MEPYPAMHLDGVGAMEETSELPAYCKLNALVETLLQRPRLLEEFRNGLANRLAQKGIVGCAAAAPDPANHCAAVQAAHANLWGGDAFLSSGPDGAAFWDATPGAFYGGHPAAELPVVDALHHGAAPHLWAELPADTQQQVEEAYAGLPWLPHVPAGQLQQQQQQHVPAAAAPAELHLHRHLGGDAPPPDPPSRNLHFQDAQREPAVVQLHEALLPSPFGGPMAAEAAQWATPAAPPPMVGQHVLESYRPNLANPTGGPPVRSPEGYRDGAGIVIRMVPLHWQPADICAALEDVGFVQGADFQDVWIHPAGSLAVVHFTMASCSKALCSLLARDRPPDIDTGMWPAECFAVAGGVGAGYVEGGVAR